MAWADDAGCHRHGASSGRSVDTITREIIQQSLGAVAQEMFAAMRKTAMSSVIFEVLDFGVAVTDADGNLASAGAGIPSFVGMLDPGVKAVIGKFGSDRVRPGDVFISNDPYAGGVSHLNDVVLVAPVFFEDELVAWTADKGHWVDIGGMTPGGISPQASERYQEGLLFPDVRLFDGGELQPAIIDLIRANSRLPDQVIGDMWAGVSALRLGARRIQDLCTRYGKTCYLEAVADYLDLAERQTLRDLSLVPNGCYPARDRLDDGREIHAEVTVLDDRFVVDLRGNPPQDSGPLNASYHATLVSAQAMFKSLVSPHTVANAGSFRPLSLICDEGSLFCARPPAAVGLYYENKIRVSDLIWKALSPVLENGASAGHFCSVCATTIGHQNDDGERHSFIEPEVGGWGAFHDRDGENAQFSSSHGLTYNCPVEVNEARNGIRVERYALTDEQGGAGRFRGGKGIDLQYRILGEWGWVTASYARSTVPPWAVAGGHKGTVNRLDILRADGGTESLASASEVRLERGDIVRIRTGVGGGYGNPRQRPAERVLADVKNGYVTPQLAREVYGVDGDRLQTLLRDRENGE